MGELVNIANVAHKTNKIESYPTDPIKTIPLDVNHSSFLEQKKNSPQHDTCGVTALAAVLAAGPELCPKIKKMKNKYCKSSIKAPTRKIIRVLLDSGSNGDLMFHKNGTPKSFPYLTR